MEYRQEKGRAETRECVDGQDWLTEEDWEDNLSLGVSVATYL